MRAPDVTSFAVFFTLLGCASTPSELVVVVDSNLDVPFEIDEVEVIVTGPSGVRSATSQSLTAPSAPTFPLTLGVSPLGDALGPVTIAAIGKLATAEVVRASARTSVVAGERRVVHLVLVRSCVGRACGTDSACGLGGCTPIDVPGDALPEWTGEPPPFDGNDPCLATAWDQDGDGQGDAMCGGEDCDDLEPRSYFGATEDCDSIDNDCNGVADEGCECTPIGVVETCTTACGTEGERECTAMGYTACTAIETCNGMDDDCDARTDEGFTYVAGPETRITTSRADAETPDLIWTGDRFALVYEESDRIFFATLDEAARLLSGPTEIADDGQTPSIAWTGTGYGVAYWDPDSVSCGADCTNTVHRVKLLRLDASGATIGTPSVLETEASSNPRPRVAWDGAGYRVLYLDGALRMHAVDAAGGIGPRVTVSGQDATGDLARAGASLAVVMATGDAVLFNEGDGRTFLGSDVVVRTTSRPRGARLASTENGYLVAWYEEDGAAIGTVPLAPGGAALATPAVQPVGSGARFGSPQTLALAAAPSQALLTFAAGRSGSRELAYRRLAPDGSELEPTTPLTLPATDSYQPTSAWAGTAFGVAWRDARDGSADQIYATTIRCE